MPHKDESKPYKQPKAGVALPPCYSYTPKAMGKIVVKEGDHSIIEPSGSEPMQRLNVPTICLYEAQRSLNESLEQEPQMSPREAFDMECIRERTESSIERLLKEDEIKERTRTIRYGISTPNSGSGFSKDQLQRKEQLPSFLQDLDEAVLGPPARPQADETTPKPILSPQEPRPKRRKGKKERKRVRFTDR